KDPDQIPGQRYPLQPTSAFPKDYDPFLRSELMARTTGKEFDAHDRVSKQTTGCARPTPSQGPAAPVGSAPRHRSADCDGHRLRPPSRCLTHGDFSTVMEDIHLAFREGRFSIRLSGALCLHSPVMRWDRAASAGATAQVVFSLLTCNVVTHQTM